MANTIINKHNPGVIAKLPALAGLEIGEIAIDNITGKLYTRKGTGVASDTIEELGGGELVKVTGEKTLYNGNLQSAAANNAFTVEKSAGDVKAEFPVGSSFTLGKDGAESVTYIINVSIFMNNETILEYKKTGDGLTGWTRIVEPVTGWKLADNPTTKSGDKSVNLLAVGDALQDGVVYVGGVKYKSYTTLEIAALGSPESGTVVYDSDKNTLQFYNGTAWAGLGSGGSGTSTGLEKVTVSGKTGMRVIDAADVAGVNTNALNLDVTAKVTDIGTNSIAIGALPKASGDASIVIGSSHGPDRVVAKASTSVIIGAATSGSMIIEEGSMGSAIIGGKNIKIDRFHLYTAVIAGEDITTKQSHTVYIPTLKFKGYDTNDVIDKKGVEPGTMMYDQQRRIFMRYTGDDWHTESPSGLEHVVEDIYMAPMVGAGVSGSTTFTSGGVEDRTAILVAGLEVFTFALTNGTHIHTKVVSSSLNAAGHTVVIVEDAFPYDMIVLSYPAAPAQNGWNFHRTPATTTGADAVNLMSSGDASQDNMVYVSGVKYKSYTTAEIAILPDSELGTVVFDSSQNRLSQCTNATPGANVWSGVGGDLSQIHQELRKEFTGVLVAGTIPAYTFTIETATGDVTSEFPDNAIFILGGGGLMAAPYTVGTATFVGGSTVINFVNPYPDIIPAFTKILADDNWGWKLGDTSLQLTGSGSVNLLGAGMGDATQPNITYVGGIKYTSYTTVQINALPGTEAGTVVYDSDKDALQYYNGTAWGGFAGNIDGGTY